MNPNYRRSNNKNDRRSDNNNDSSKKEVLKEDVDEFKEAFVKDKDPKISYTILKEQYFDAPDERLKSKFVCESPYLN